MLFSTIFILVSLLFLLDLSTQLHLYLSGVILQTARAEEEKANEDVGATAAVTTKDDIARLIHLFKYPGAQVHWSNLYGVLNRTQLDARRTTGPASDAANPLSCLAEIFNSYDEFKPQNEMIAYENDAVSGKPRMKSPWEPSSEEWEELAIQTYDIDPTNLARRNVYRDAIWVKNTWNDVRKYLYQVFKQYNRSGQRSGDMGEWCSPGEQQRWVRAAFWKGAGSNTIVRFPTAMIYSIAVLEQADFDGIGRQMPKGTGADNSVAVADADTETTQARKNRKKRGPYKKRPANNNTVDDDGMMKALREGTQTEAKLSALRLLLEYGSEEQRKKAMKQIDAVAYGKDRRKKKKKKKNGASTPESSSSESSVESVSTEVSPIEGLDSSSSSSSD